MNNIYWLCKKYPSLDIPIKNELKWENEVIFVTWFVFLKIIVGCVCFVVNHHKISKVPF